MSPRTGQLHNDSNANCRKTIAAESVDCSHKVLKLLTKTAKPCVKCRKKGGSKTISSFTMTEKPPSIPGYSLKRLGKAIEGRGDTPLQAVVSNDTVEVIVETKEEIQPTCDEERQSVEDAAKETSSEGREEVASTPAPARAAAVTSDATAASTPPNSKPPTTPTTRSQRRQPLSRRAKMRGSRILKFAPLRFRAALANVTSPSSTSVAECKKTVTPGKRETRKAPVPVQHTAVESPGQEAEPPLQVLSTEKKETPEEEPKPEEVANESVVSCVLGKKYLTMREQSLDRRILALERHLEQVSEDEASASEQVPETKSEVSSAFVNISHRELSNFERFISMKQPKESYSNDSLEENSQQGPVRSWLTSDREQDEETTDDSDEESHETFHSFLVNHPNAKFASYRGTFSDYGTDTDGSYDTESGTLGDRATFTFDSEGDTHGSRTDGSYTDGGGSFTDGGGSFTDGGGSYTDGGERTDGSYTEEGEETDLGSHTLGSLTDENDETDNGGESTVEGVPEVLSDPDPFSELQLTNDDSEAGGNETDVSVDMFQYKEGHFLVVI